MYRIAFAMLLCVLVATCVTAQGGLEASLLRVGAKAPNITLQKPDGTNYDLTKAMKAAKTKATLIDFWFIGCPPCRRALPHLIQMYGDLKSKGFNIVAVNLVDTASQISTYVKQNKVPFTTLVGRGSRTVARQYGVVAVPTTYLLDSQGKVVERFVGFDGTKEKRLIAALAKLGVKK
jgi:thiol-disulfide isomerase/thioredoxin